MIEVKNLVKRYGTNTALKGISFSFEDGHIYGFLGPNGAGKSTTMNIITGCLGADEGEVLINGMDMFYVPMEAKKTVGYLPEQPPLYGDMTPREYLTYVGRMKGIKRSAIKDEVDRVIAATGLEEYEGKIIRNLSKGYKQRTGIAQAILGSPETIILDEPTVGLDPIQIREIRDMIRELGKTHTVILSSHILSEIKEICEYAVIISEGKIVAYDTIEALVTGNGNEAVIKLDIKSDSETAERILSSSDIISSFSIDGYEDGVTKATVKQSGGEDIRDRIFGLFADARVPILSMSYEERSLENVFVELTQETENGSAPVTDTYDGDTEHEAEAGTEDVPEEDVTAEEKSDGDYVPQFGAEEDDGE